MLVKMTSDLSGRTHEMDIPVTPYRLHRWRTGSSAHELIQDEFPDLSADQREFLKTGIIPEEWNSFIGVEPDSDDEDDIV